VSATLNKDNNWQTYKRLLGYTKPYRYAFVLCVFGYLLYALAQASLPTLMQYLPDVFEENNEINGVYDFLYKFKSAEQLGNILPLFIILIAITRGVGSFFGGYFIAVFGRSVINDLRIELFSKIQILPIDFFSSNNQGSSSDIISVLTFNIEQITQAITMALRTLLREGLTIVGLLGFLLYLNWQLTLIFLLVTPLIGGVVAFASKFLRRYSSRIQDSMGDVAKVASENINGLSEVRIYGGQSLEKSRFSFFSLKNLKQTLKLSFVSELSSPIIQVIVFSSLAGLFWIGLNTGLRVNMNSGDFLFYITAAAMIAKPLKQITSVNVHIQKGVVAAKSVFDLFDTPTELDTGQISIEKVKGKIEFKDLCFRYPTLSLNTNKQDTNILENISLSILPGQTVALVGRSGAGKTTLANLLSRQMNPSSGQILIDDVSLDEYRLKDLRKQIAFVGQNVVLFDDTVANNVAYGELRDTTEERVLSAITSAHAGQFVDALTDGIQTNIGENGANLSGGQRQRLALARAFLKDAPILILDEATSTIENADSIVVMDAGKIIEQGSHKELIAKGGAYTQLYKMQFKEA